MCLGVTLQRKLGATGTTVGNVVMSAVITARTSGTGVTMGEGIAITGGTERLRSICEVDPDDVLGRSIR
jgi:hypothetical protein